MIDDRDVRILLPQVRRYLDPGVASATAASDYSDDMLVHVAADSIAELILLGGDGFPYVLSASAIDTSGYPTEYMTEPALPFELRALVAVQAAISQTFAELNDLKISEKISDEGSSWEWTKSVNAAKEKLRNLFDIRKSALAAVARANPVLDQFTNILQVRDATIQAEIEPYDA